MRPRGRRARPSPPRRPAACRASRPPRPRRPERAARDHPQRGVPAVGGAAHQPHQAPPRGRDGRPGRPADHARRRVGLDGADLARRRRPVAVVVGARHARPGPGEAVRRVHRPHARARRQGGRGARAARRRRDAARRPAPDRRRHRGRGLPRRRARPPHQPRQRGDGRALARRVRRGGPRRRGPRRGPVRPAGRAREHGLDLLRADGGRPRGARRARMGRGAALRRGPVDPARDGRARRRRARRARPHRADARPHGQRDDRTQRRLARGVRRHGEHPDARLGELAQRRERDDRRAVRGGQAAARPRLTAAPPAPASLAGRPGRPFCERARRTRDACDGPHRDGSTLARSGAPVVRPLTPSYRRTVTSPPGGPRPAGPHQSRCAPEVSVPENESTTAQTGLENLLHETRSFPPSPEFAAQANAKPEPYEEARADRLAFWARQANDLVTWRTPFTETLDWSQAPVARWFADGTLNAAYNAVDRHVEAGLGDRVAIHFEGEPGDTRTVTYAELQRDVARAANALAALGVETGDRVVIYLPMIVEAVVAMLACARIGAPHSVVFGGFSADALRSRIADAEAKVVITADGGYRRGAPSALKPAV